MNHYINHIKSLRIISSNNFWWIFQPKKQTMLASVQRVGHGYRVQLSSPELEKIHTEET